MMTTMPPSLPPPSGPPPGAGGSAGGSEASAAAERLLDRLRGFVASLPEDERALLAALLAPGVAEAYEPHEADLPDEVVGFGLEDEVTWHPAGLPSALAETIRNHDVRVVGLDH